MASRDSEENAPLLSNTEEPPIERISGSRKIKSLYETSHLFQANNGNNDTGDYNMGLPVSSSMASLQFPNAEQDSVVSIFVIAFDTKAGIIKVLTYVYLL